MDRAGELSGDHAGVRRAGGRTRSSPRVRQWVASPATNKPQFDETVRHEPTTVVYAAPYERGQRVLDALAERLSAWGLGIELEAHTRRRRLYPGIGLTIEPSALDRQLSALDSPCHEHVTRLV